MLLHVLRKNEALGSKTTGPRQNGMGGRWRAGYKRAGARVDGPGVRRQLRRRLHVNPQAVPSDNELPIRGNPCYPHLLSGFGSAGLLRAFDQVLQGSLLLWRLELGGQTQRPAGGESAASEPNREILLFSSLGREAVDMQLAVHLPPFSELNIISHPRSTKQQNQDIDSPNMEVLELYIPGGRNQLPWTQL